MAPRLAKLEALTDQDSLDKARKAVAALTDKSTGDEQWRALTSSFGLLCKKRARPKN